MLCGDLLPLTPCESGGWIRETGKLDAHPSASGGVSTGWLLSPLTSCRKAAPTTLPGPAAAAGTPEPASGADESVSGDAADAAGADIGGSEVCGCRERLEGRRRAGAGSPAVPASRALPITCSIVQREPGCRLPHKGRLLCEQRTTRHMNCRSTGR